ncbi:hypothetical protein BCR32DRAFT_293031 [Anaeromyces robustus]|uniref:Uncharacterized protein n=1 Tax=Anaeromyces robustus TaxID=1754192 RepID=A0A1Y1X807_9FUNG|nr:hypothetical protein BCR32DRAFT_293031 [Anaeromyces robustus]|eukprot:ORX81865.1 hypothetical protein BCR32DRAFT_293031 [Anaeromyces robustus]
MNKADSNLLNQLFKENNELRAQINVLNRDVFNRTIQNENAEEEIRQLQAKIEILTNENKKASAQTGSRKESPNTPGDNIYNTIFFSEDDEMPHNTKSTKDDINTVKETEQIIEDKNNEITKLKEDLSQARTYIEQQKVIANKLETEIQECQDQINIYKAKEEEDNDSNDISSNVDNQYSSSKEINKNSIETTDEKKKLYNEKIIEISNNSNLKFNNQQIQLQGIESLIESIRLEYEEFIEATKLENDSYNKSQKEEFDLLRNKFMQYKQEQNQKQRDSYWEFQSLLYSMQTQFEEYRTTSEFLFNSEIAKMEDEITSLTLRYEQEILYITQAKDRFYSDMMVTKDAKIMNLVEGSDLKEVIKHHELEIENIRREHACEIERIKSEQENEQSNIIALLQRQNSALESKCEKLSTHIKSQDDKLKDMLSIINQKNKIIIDKEDEKDRIELNLQKQLTSAMNKVYTLTQDCEYLRNKIIRLSLSAKGEGGNTIKNILKRISRETNKLSNDFDKVSNNYSTILNDYEVTVKKLKEKEKLITFLEKEVKRRTDEFDSMSRTFEDFLTQRARQLRLERSDRLMKMLQQQRLSYENENYTNLERSRKDIIHKKGTIKTIVPTSSYNMNKNFLNSIDNSQEKVELERGFEYLRRFKTLSKSFRHGDILPSTNKNYSFTQENGPWTKTELYNRVIKPVNVHIPKIYNPNDESSKNSVSKFLDSNIDDDYYNNNETTKSTLYKPLNLQENTSFIKVYERNNKKT